MARPNHMAGFQVRLDILTAEAIFVGKQGTHAIPLSFLLVDSSGEKIKAQNILKSWMQSSGFADQVAIAEGLKLNERLQAGERIFAFYPAVDFAGMEVTYPKKRTSVSAIQLGCILVFAMKSLERLQ